MKIMIKDQVSSGISRIGRLNIASVTWATVCLVFQLEKMKQVIVQFWKVRIITVPSNLQVHVQYL